MGPSQGLIDSLNAIREMSVKDGKVFHQYIPVVDANTPIETFARPMLENEEVLNEFIPQLIKRIVYTMVETKIFNNPLQDLEGEVLPFGYAGQEIYINPVKPRKFNAQDFAGLLKMYETDAKVQYTQINSDLQYPISISYDDIRTAMTSWNNLENFVNAQYQALYNGAFITRYNQVRQMVASAYNSGRVNVQTVTDVTDETSAKALVTAMREAALNFQVPDENNNAWKKVGGYGPAVVTWSDISDIRILIRNDVLATTSVNVLAEAFNLSETDFLGRVIGVKDFNIYDEDGNLLLDGSKIVAIMADKSWFRIRQQQFRLNQQFMANNEVWQCYLRDTRMVNYSLFANAVVFATAEPTIKVESLTLNPNNLSVAEGSTANAGVVLEPFSATDEITVESGSEGVATAVLNERQLTVTGVAAGNTIITVSAGGKSATLAVTVTTA